MNANDVRIATMVSLIGGYLSLLATNILTPLNKYLVLGVTILQLIFGAMIAMLGGFILKKWVFDGASGTDTLRQSVDVIQEISGGQFTPEQSAQFLKDSGKAVGKSLWKEMKAKIKPHKKINFVSQPSLPSAEELYATLRSQYRVLAIQEITVEQSAQTPSPEDQDKEISCIAASAETGFDLESGNNFRTRALLIFCGIIGLVIILNVTMAYWDPYLERILL